VAAIIHETQLHGDSCTPCSSLVAAGGAASEEIGVVAGAAVSLERGKDAVAVGTDGVKVLPGDGATADVLGTAEPEVAGSAGDEEPAIVGGVMEVAADAPADGVGVADDEGG
jgi:hypothetical protein